MDEGDQRGQEQQAEPEGDNEVARLVVQQAEAVAEGEGDATSKTPSERRHMGHDVPMSAQASQDFDPRNLEQDIPPPAYGEYYGAIRGEQDGFGTKASVADDGRVDINIHQLDRRLSTLFVPALRKQQDLTGKEHALPPPYIPPSLGGEEGVPPPPPLNVVIQVVGSRGDVQPFIALGKVLKETYGHRVRMATHPVFNDFVKESGLEFFSIGGDPAQLMAFMVRNPGLMPGFDSLRSGDIGKRRKEVGEYLKGCWRSCFETGDGLGPEANDDTIEDWTLKTADEGDNTSRPFVADCIIANPPSFAHVHCAEKLGIPLHVMFTMPYSPTQAFPHPLANIQSSNADQHLTNYISYALIDMLTWQGLGDVFNRFRQKQLGLDPISLAWAPGMLQRLRIPHTYCWSPALIPKPKDWAQHISISGFFFLNLASSYTPAPDLQDFLQAGPPPVYIGFGSIVLDDPNAMTKLIFEAVVKTGQRALVSKGWGGVGADDLGKPDNVFMLGNVPHDWLFKHVSCVVHHGGAGTTAAGITAGRPTVVVPFFGDQTFWGSMVARAGAGPQPIPNKQLTADNLAEAIKVCLKPESQERAQELADRIKIEHGTDIGAQSFHQYLDVDKLRCNLAPSRAAVWRVKRTQVRLSAFAACTLANEGLLDFKDIKLFRPREYETDEGPWDPISGGGAAIMSTMTTMMMGVADFPIETLKALKIHPDAAKKKPEEGESNGEVGSSKSTTDESGRTSNDKDSTKHESSATTDIVVPSGELTPATSRSNSPFNLQESLAKIQSPTSPEARLSPQRMPSSMREALSGQLNQKPRSRSRTGSDSRPRSSSSAGDQDASVTNMMETTVGTSRGIRRIIDAGLTSPMDFSLAVSKGFHNAPKLYGDDTVRKSDQVTDMRSGMRAAAKGFGLGVYDGISGLVTQPVRGAQKEGAAGFLKGFGKGIGGVMLKPAAGFFAIPAYMQKGVYKEMQKHFGSSVQNYIIAARTAQGYEEWQHSMPEQRRDVVQRWKHLQADLKKKRNPDEMVRDILEEKKRKKQDLVERWSRTWDEKGPSRNRAASTGQARRNTTTSEARPDPEKAMLKPGTPETQIGHARTFTGGEAEDAELEEAIHLSVQETSRGDAEEDAALERAIKDSLAELQRPRWPSLKTEEEEHEHIRNALEVSQAEASTHGHSISMHDIELENALAQSLKEQKPQQSSDNEWHSRLETEDDEDFKRAIRESQHPATREVQNFEHLDAQHLEGTTQQDFEQQHAQGDEKTRQEKDEEQVVIEYVKKQTMLEEEHRQKAVSKGKAPVRKDTDDENLEQALKMSMQRDGQHGEASEA